MNRILAVLLSLFMVFCTNAQKLSVFSGLLYNNDTMMAIHLNLDSANVKVPGLPFLGGTNGYMSNGILYGTWIVTDFKVDKNNATIRLTNDFGADTQKLLISHIKADTFSVELQQPIAMRRVVKGKLVKINPKYIFIKR